MAKRTIRLIAVSLFISLLWYLQKHSNYDFGNLFSLVAPFISEKSANGGGKVALVTYNKHGVPRYNASKSSSSPIFRQPEDSWTLSDISSSLGTVRLDHPRLFADYSKWSELFYQIGKDDYLAEWNNTIHERASKLHSQPPANYSIDGSLYGSGVLDIAREVQLRIKLWAFAYRLSLDEQWKHRIWDEIYTTSGNSSSYFGPERDNWNTKHWLDVGEFLVAFSIAYDWLYDAWQKEEREAIMWSIISLGLAKGLEAYERDDWFLSARGNWNCVTNGGMIIGALSIIHDDPTGIAEKLLLLAVQNARQFCAQAVESDGTWSETPDYWYFGTQAHSQLVSALHTATGSTHGLLTAARGFRDTAFFHIYNNGMTEKFNYGDCGPVKLTATANSLFFYGNAFRNAIFPLYQRDKRDAADPLSMLWYNPDISGEWFYDLPLDRAFQNSSGAWVSMRSSWTEPEGLFVAMKAGKLMGHSTHGNLDAGDFVLDAMGERWVGELCQDDYLADGYFASEDQKSKRWNYYRCGTAGQNTIVVGGFNQLVTAVPLTWFDSTEYSRSADHNTSTAYWTSDLSSAYQGAIVRRGLRLLNDRKQVLVQDEIESIAFESEWRIHTNATITYSSDKKVAHLVLNDKHLDVILHTTSNLSFLTVEAESGDSGLRPSQTINMENYGVSVLSIKIPRGNTTIQVTFSPRWSEEQGIAMPVAVPLDNWSLHSHE